MDSLSNSPIFSNAGISGSEIIKCEKAILCFLNWKTMVPTPTDIVNQLLFISNSTHDFSALLEKINEYIMISLIMYSMSRYSSSNIALGSLLLVLEE